MRRWNDKPNHNVCGYDFAYAFKKVSLDFCGRSPSYEEFIAFKDLDENEKPEALSNQLDACLSTAFWKGRDGVLWRLAHAKIRPLAAIKSGANAGAVPLGDYDDDYPLFVYTQTGDTDARDVLKAKYYVVLTNNAPPTYQVVQQNRSNRLCHQSELA